MPIIGREPPAEIVIPAPQVSARHAEIHHLSGDLYQITDLGSTNGTFVNGKRISSASIRLSDAVNLGTQAVDLTPHRHLIPLVAEPGPAAGSPPLAGTIPPASGPQHPAPALPSPLAAASDAFPREALLWVAAALIVGCLLPVVGGRGGSDVVFLNFELLGQERVSGLVKLLLLYPLLAGVATIVVAANVTGMARAVWFLSLGLLPWLLIPSGNAGSELPLGRAGGLGSGPLLALLLGNLGLCALFAGARGRELRPLSRGAAMTGAIGGGAYLLSLLLPAEVPGLTGKTVQLMVPFELLGKGDQHDGLVVLGLVALVTMGLWGAASVQCLTIAGPRPDAGRRAAGAFRLWLAAAGVAAAAALVASLVIRQGHGAAALAMVKILLSFGGVIALMLIGLTELIVTLADRPAGGGHAT